MLGIIQNDVEELLVIVQTTQNNYQVLSNRRRITISDCPKQRRQTISYCQNVVKPPITYYLTDVEYYQ